MGGPPVIIHFRWFSFPIKSHPAIGPYGWRFQKCSLTSIQTIVECRSHTYKYNNQTICIDIYFMCICLIYMVYVCVIFHLAGLESTVSHPSPQDLIAFGSALSAMSKRAMWHHSLVLFEEARGALLRRNATW